MTTHLVTFSDESMSRARELCLASARMNGVSLSGGNSGAFFHEYTPDFLKGSGIDASQRGVGFWAWKPFIINDVLSKRGSMWDMPCHDGDILIYADAGVEFINNVNYIIDQMDQDIFLFGNNWEHAHWCKADVVAEIWSWGWAKRPPGTPMWHNFGKQVQASVIFFRVSNYTRTFVAEWLKWCLYDGGRLIDDSPSIIPEYNHPEFREHRHDQAILTTMAYREGIKLHYWSAQYNDGAFTYEKLPEYANDDYPILFHHHRRRNHEWSSAA
jgi:hypothetical protein